MARDLTVLLGQTAPFSRLPPDLLAQVASGAREMAAAPGEAILVQGDIGRDYVVLLEGRLEVTRQIPGEAPLVVGTVGPGAGVGEMAVLSALPREASVTALAPVRYLRIDGDTVDSLLACSPAFLARLQHDAVLRQRLSLIRLARPFRNLPAEKIELAFDRMSSRRALTGENVIIQGEMGDYFYLIEAGQAEVRRTEQGSDDEVVVRTLGPGETFGEEALITGAFRNATVRMTASGVLWRLDKAGFDALLRTALVEEIEPAIAWAQVGEGLAALLDCRDRPEFIDAHLPGAAWMPLDELRDRAADLDRDRRYVLYCRSGRRSASGAFLLRERGFDARSMRGGITAWPFELERGG